MSTHGIKLELLNAKGFGGKKSSCESKLYVLVLFVCMWLGDRMRFG